MSVQNAIRVSNLVVEHNTASGLFRALDFPDFSIEGGSSMAVVGPSGCGKSTLLGVLAGLELPTSGSITIGDTCITDLPEDERVTFRKDAIGIVYQADNLLPFLTVTENIQLQLALRGLNEDAEDRITETFSRLGLSELKHRLPDQLSGGQRQRVAIARATVHRPDVILADEPTGSLDDRNTEAVVELLRDAREHLSSTLVIVTHNPVVAASMDRMVTLRDGCIVSDSEVKHAG